MSVRTMGGSYSCTHKLIRNEICLKQFTFWKIPMLSILVYAKLKKNNGRLYQVLALDFKIVFL